MISRLLVKHILYSVVVNVVISTYHKIYFKYIALCNGSKPTRVSLLSWIVSLYDIFGTSFTVTADRRFSLRKFSHLVGQGMSVTIVRYTFSVDYEVLTLWSDGEHFLAHSAILYTYETFFFFNRAWRTYEHYELIIFCFALFPICSS